MACVEANKVMEKEMLSLRAKHANEIAVMTRTHAMRTRELENLITQLNAQRDWYGERPEPTQMHVHEHTEVFNMDGEQPSKTTVSVGSFQSCDVN